MSKIIGIDLGTSNSCVAIAENGGTKVIENSEGNRTTPSVIAYMKDGEIVVGDSAKRQEIVNPKNTVYSAKRLIGRRYDDKEVQRDISLVPYKIIKADNGDAWIEVLDNKRLAPQQVSAEVLRKMKKTAEDYLGESVTEAVITVPAYFNDAQRQATKDAGRIAGLEVKRIINEPTAAALAFGVNKIDNDKKIVVFDFGGGTHDVSVIEVSVIDGEKTFEVVSTNGNTHLGGNDVDQRLTNYFIDEFKKEQGIDLRKDVMALQRLNDAAEKAKIELSSRNQTEINLPYITADATGPKHFNMTLTRTKFENMIEDIVEHTIEPVRKALADANLTVNDIGDVLLVGGSTRIPCVQRAVEEFFGKAPRKDVNPDEAVAVGAAIQGSVLTGENTNILLLDVCPLTLSLETMGDVATPMIERNTTIPTKVEKVFSTAVDNQPAVTLKLYQGERKVASANKLLGQFDLDGIPPAPRGIPQISVTVDIDANGIISVSAKDKSTGKEQHITIKSDSGLSEEQIQQMVNDAEKNKAEDEKRVSLANARNSADGSVAYVKKNLKEYGDKLSAEDKKKIEDSIAKVEETTRGNDYEAIDNAVKEMMEAAQRIGEILAQKQSTEQSNNTASEEKNNKEDAVDADYTEVK